MAINDNLLYEVNERGERVLVKSIESFHRAFLRFTNRTVRPVDIWWRDFNGIKHHYMRLNPTGVYDVNSYVTHPWEFTDVATKERCLVNRKPIFRAPPSIGGMLHRTNWNITIDMRTLRETALIAIALRIPKPKLASTLQLPLRLEQDLRDRIKVIRNITVEEGDEGQIEQAQEVERAQEAERAQEVEQAQEAEQAEEAEVHEVEGAQEAHEADGVD